MAIPTTGCAPCTPAVCNTCSGPTEAYVTNPIVQTYSVWDIINTHCDEGYKIYDLMCQDFDVWYLPNLLFGTTKPTDGRGVSNLMPKTLPGIMPTMSTDGLGVKRWEKDRTLDEAFITANGGPTNIIPVSRTNFVLVGDVVRILICDPLTCCQVEIIRKVTAINPGVSITVDGAPITFFINNPLVDCANKVIRLYETYNLCDTVVGRQVLDTITDKVSYFQHIGEKVCFTLDEINKCYATPGGAVGFVNEVMYSIRRRMFDSIQNIVWFGRNKTVAANVVGDGPETMGIITGIVDAENRCGLTLTRDLSCLTTQDEKIAAFMDEIRKASECGVWGNREIAVVGNARAIGNIMQMNSAWNRLLGCIPTCSGQDKNFSIFTINTPFGSKVSFYADAALTRHYQNQSIMVFIPKDWIAMYTYANVMDSQANVVRNQPAMFLNFKDISHLEDAKFNCSYCYKMTGSFAIGLIGLCTGKWRILYGM